ncbi:MAG TPA: hypothetical protein VK467_04165 [Gemmatimonadales bacterium]|nr:hypothetical protein [Gemmatimonadales bacterium]
MADNTSLPPSATKAATDEVTYSGDIAVVQVVRQAHVIGAEGSKTVTDMSAPTGTPAAASLSVHELPATSGGCSTLHRVSTGAVQDQAIVKASPGQVFGVYIYNNSVSPVFVKFHNQVSLPTAGVGVVAAVGMQAGVSNYVPIAKGRAFSVGIGITIVLEIADNGTTAVAAGACVVDVDYK